MTPHSHWTPSETRRTKWYHTEIASYFFGLAFLALFGFLFIWGLILI